jgi:hypothetical protein
MLSVVIATHDDETGLLPTLAALVPGATAGLVREVIVADAGVTDATAKIADIAGCRFVATAGTRGERLSRGAAWARSSWLLFLRPGLVPEAIWIEEVRQFVEQAEIAGRIGREAAIFRPRSAGSIGGDALALLRRAFGARPDGGLLIAKPLYDEVGGHDPRSGEPERDLVRRLGSRRLTLLRSSASLAGGQYI